MFRFMGTFFGPSVKQVFKNTGVTVVSAGISWGTYQAGSMTFNFFENKYRKHFLGPEEVRPGPDKLNSIENN